MLTFTIKWGLNWHSMCRTGTRSRPVVRGFTSYSPSLFARRGEIRTRCQKEIRMMPRYVLNGLRVHDLGKSFQWQVIYRHPVTYIDEVGKSSTEPFPSHVTYTCIYGEFLWSGGTEWGEQRRGEGRGSDWVQPSPHPLRFTPLQILHALFFFFLLSISAVHDRCFTSS